jgi:magnesium-transporting ATPase (P-type)
MAVQILFMAAWLTAMSFVFLTVPWFADFFGGQDKLYTAYFVLFVISALFNGFNVRDDGSEIFSRLGDNPDFLRVWVIIAAVQMLIVNAALVPLEAFKWIGAMFSCTPFSLAGWGLVFVLAFTMIPVDLLRKQIIKG